MILFMIIHCGSNCVHLDNFLWNLLLRRIIDSSIVVVYSNKGGVSKKGLHCIACHAMLL